MASKTVFSATFRLKEFYIRQNIVAITRDGTVWYALKVRLDVYHVWKPR